MAPDWSINETESSRVIQLTDVVSAGFLYQLLSVECV